MNQIIQVPDISDYDLSDRTLLLEVVERLGSDITKDVVSRAPLVRDKDFSWERWNPCQNGDHLRRLMGMWEVLDIAHVQLTIKMGQWQVIPVLIDGRQRAVVRGDHMHRTLVAAFVVVAESCGLTTRMDKV